MAKPQTLGRTAETAIAQNLRDYGRVVQVRKHKSPYDLLVDGMRIEIKCSDVRVIRDVPTWWFNIHRHGVLNEQCDFYIFRLENVPFSKYAIHLLYKAPLSTPVASVSFRSLLSRDAIAVVDFYRFARGELSVTTPMAA